MKVFRPATVRGMFMYRYPAIGTPSEKGEESKSE